MRTATDLQVNQAYALATQVGTRPAGYWANFQKPADCAKTGR